MKVAYDMSMLGVQHSAPSGRRGIDRVVEEVLLGLADSPEISLSLTATHAFYGSRKACDQYEALTKVPLLGTPGYEAVSKLCYMATAYVQATLNQRVAWRRIVRRALVELVALSQRWEERLPQKLLQGINIFHSSYHRIPSTLRGLSGLECFLTIYDLIPFHHQSHPDATKLRRIVDSLRPTDWIICISESVKGDICNQLSFDPSRVFVTPLAASKTTFRPCNDLSLMSAARQRYGIPATSPYLLSLSAMEERKNLPFLIGSFGELVASGEAGDLCLVLVGKQNQHQTQSLLTLIETAGLAGRVILTGYVPDVDLAAIYSGALAFVFPSLAEGFGLPPLEAMQCGVPVIASNTTSLPEVVGDAGLLVNPTDRDALCQSLLEIRRDSALRQRLSGASLRRAAEFSWERCVAQTIAAYRVALS